MRQQLSKIISPAMHRQMRQIDAHACYLAVLRPGTAKLDLISIFSEWSDDPVHDRWYDAMNAAFDDLYEEIEQAGSKWLESLSSATVLFELCRKLIDRVRRADSSLEVKEQYLKRVAVRWLEESPFPLGSGPRLSDDEAHRWRSGESERAQLRTQDAIEWRAMYWRSLDKAKARGDIERYEGCEELGISGYGRPVILKVPQSANRPYIVDLSNLKAFVAEHLFAYYTVAPYLAILNELNISTKPPSLTFFLQPLRGLGQCRAVVDWEAVDGAGQTSDRTFAQLLIQPSEMQLRGLDSIFTQSLLRSFSDSFRQSLSDLLERSSGALNGLRHSVADLWWAMEVRFSLNDKLTSRLIRSERDEDEGWQEASSADEGNWNVDWQNYEGEDPGFFATSGESYPKVTYLRLSLSNLIEAKKHSDPSLNATSQTEIVSHTDLEDTLVSLSFDEVQFACHFFDIDQEDLDEWVDRLGDVIYDELIQHTAQRLRIDRQRSAGLESAAHWVNSLIRNADRASAARRIKRILDDGEPRDYHYDELRAVLRSLDLWLLVEGGASLMRLLGVLGHKEYGKLANWFTISSMQEWEDPASFEKYQRSITHLARALGSVRGYPAVSVATNGEETHYHDYCHLDFDELRFPPLSKRGGREPILALLPALTEPLSNALSYLETLEPHNGQPEKAHPIKLQIEDCRKSALPHILVKIGNRYFSNDRILPTGIAKARDFMKIAKVATIGEPEIEELRDGNYLWVPVFLHPQQLCQLIQNS